MINKKPAGRFHCVDGSSAFPLVLGTMYFGTRISQPDAAELLDLYTSLGGNQIDTARSYASWLDQQNGTSERTIGAWLRRYAGREGLFIGTKGGLMPRGYNSDRGNLDASHLAEELHESLESLGTDYVDVFWLHRDERERPVEEIVDTCEAFVRQGLVRYLGVSNWTTERIRQANSYARDTGKQGFSMSQIQFGLGICTPGAWGDDSVVCMDEPSYEWYQQADLPLYAYSAQAQGFFSQVLTQGSNALDEDTRKKYLTEENLARAGIMAQISEREGIPIAAMVLNYVLSREFETCLVLGCSKTARLREAFMALEVEVPDAVWEEITGKVT